MSFGSNGILVSLGSYSSSLVFFYLFGLLYSAGSGVNRVFILVIWLFSRLKVVLCFVVVGYAVYCLTKSVCIVFVIPVFV